MGAKEGENQIYKLTKIREIKTRDLNGVRYIKDEVREVMKASWHICSVHHIQARGWRDNNDIGRYATACLLKSS